MKSSSSHFPSVGKIAYEGPRSANALAFRHYNPAELVDGQSMKDRLRFSIAYWHAFAGRAPIRSALGTINRPWESGKDAVLDRQGAHGRRLRVLPEDRGAVWCFHDRDIAPEGRTLAESNKHLDALVAHAKGLQKATGVKLLWGTANLFSNPPLHVRCVHQPGRHVFAYAAAQVKKALDVTQELGGENYVFWGRPRGLRDAPQHQPEARTGPSRRVPAPGGRLRQVDRLQGPVPHRAEAEGADQAPVRL
ncbi:MAG: hypothetical protein WDM96_00545 [Lacunisphaera sp.]